MITDADLPAATHQAELRLGSVVLRTYVLDDGGRIIHADDMAALLAAFEDGLTMSAEDAETLRDWLKGRGP